MQSYSLSHNVIVIFEFCAVGRKTGNIELHQPDMSVSVYWIWRWRLSLEDETLIISKINNYSSVPPELFYFKPSKPPELFYFTLERS